MYTLDVHRSTPTLADRWELEEGRVLLTGAQACVRLPLDLRRADQRAGARTGSFISGYQGSPLGGLDKDWHRLAPLREELGVEFVPGLNEELAATAVFATQLVPTLPGAQVDGVTGWWYGKNPGLDRAADAIRHGTFAGTHRAGGVVLFVGDDPGCKSSTLPSAAEATLVALDVCVLHPSGVQDVLDLGRHAVALSRASGLPVALKVVTSVADGSATVEVGPRRVVPVLPDGAGAHEPHGVLLAQRALDLEAGMPARRDLAARYVELNGLNVVRGATGRARLGIVSAGHTRRELDGALARLGLDDGDLRRLGVRRLDVAVVHPLPVGDVRRFADGLDEVLVVEEKHGHLEGLVARALYGVAQPPRLTGKQDVDGTPLVPAVGEVLVDDIVKALARRLPAHVGDPSLTQRLADLATPASRAPIALPVSTTRVPTFCSGCPHSQSTKVAAGSLTGAGIGCHTMVLLQPEGRGEITGVTQMGGEGAQWIGLAPFVTDEHFTQNLGDGTFHHSGSLAIRAAVAAGSDITYKVLYNGFVAMTGGQGVEGQLSLAAMTHWLKLEGVAQVVVTSDDPGRHDPSTFAPGTQLRHRDELAAVQDELRAVKGVTVLIHEQPCAAESRRLRKRGDLPAVTRRAHINERVCEGCGDCGAKSSCPSVQPVDTPFGRKTRIDQSSCNVDLTCAKGDCPSFLEVTPRTAAKDRAPLTPPVLPDRRVPAAADVTLRFVGVGGTGVVTIAQVLAMAAHIEGKHTAGLDQTGLAQKGGPVTSDLRISTDPITGPARAASGTLDGLVVFDALGAVDPARLAAASRERTVAVVSSSVPATIAAVTDPDVVMPGIDGLLRRLHGRTRQDATVVLDAATLADRLAGSAQQANTLLVGAAFEAGLIPLGVNAVREAFRLNGAAVERNLAAFEWGRALVADPALADRTLAEEQDAVSALPAALDGRVAALGLGPDDDEAVRRLAGELVAYQGPRYAARFLDTVELAAAADRDGRLVRATAEGLHKLMAYKDEYEVARLHRDPRERARVRREFGDDAQVRFLLHPPALRALGLQRKLRLRPGVALPAFAVLCRMKGLRGTALDPFGRAEVRRVERALVAEHEQALHGALGTVTEDTYEQVVALAQTPSMVRGYEEIKLRNAGRYRAERDRIVARLG